MTLFFEPSSATSRRRAASPPQPDPVALLRERLTSDLHMGNVRTGDRLPSIRQVAREYGLDHRAVARAYRALEKEGLVKIQGRSGVRVACGALGGAGTGSDPPTGDEWLVEVLAESWMRSLTAKSLQRMLEALADASRLRCACVESNVDQMTAYCEEVRELSGMRMLPVHVSSDTPDAAGLARVREELAGADLVVTTQYHAATVRAAVGREGIPVVVLRVNPELAEAMRKHLRRQRLTVVAATLEFGERLRRMYDDVIRSDAQLRVVLASDADAVRTLDLSEPVLLTRAARELLPTLSVPQLIFPNSPTLAPDSIRELAEHIVRLRLG